jgi:hypothetical protein
MCHLERRREAPQSRDPCIRFCLPEPVVAFLPSRTSVLCCPGLAGYDYSTVVTTPHGETELHMFTVGGGTPQETVDEIGNKLGARGVSETKGHGIIVEARHYDHFLGADAGRNMVAQGRGPAGSYNFFQSAETGQGRLARNADTVRKLGQWGRRRCRRRVWSIHSVST